MKYKYNYEYLHRELLHLKNCDYYQYRDSSVFDLFLHKINSEEIYNLHDVDWADLSDDLIKLLDNDFNSQVISSNWVKIKLILYIQNVAFDWFPSIDRVEQIETQCASLISQLIEQESRHGFHGFYNYMPRIDLRRWLQYPNIFTEVTPLKLLENNHQEILNDTLHVSELFKDYIDCIYPEDIQRFNFNIQRPSTETDSKNQPKSYPHICDFNFMSPSFVETDDYQKRWLYHSPNSKFSFTYPDVAFGIYPLIQTKSLIEYSKFIRSYANAHPGFEIKDTNDREEFIHEVHSIVIEIVSAFFRFSSPGGNWNINGEDYWNMSVEQVDEVLRFNMWQQALEKLAGVTELKASDELALLKTRHSELHDQFASLQAKCSGLASVIRGNEKFIAELQETNSSLQQENRVLQEELFYLKKELSLGHTPKVIANKSTTQLEEVTENATEDSATDISTNPQISSLFRVDKIEIDVCCSHFQEIITTTPQRGKQKVLSQLLSAANTLYFNPSSFGHEELAAELNRLQNKFVFTKADIDAAYKK